MPKQEVAGKNLRSLAENDDMERHLRGMAEAITKAQEGEEEVSASAQDGLSVYDFSTSLRHKYGGSVNIQVSAAICSTSTTKLLHLRVKLMEGTNHGKSF